VVPFPGETDLCVVNTCTVTAVADRKSRAAVRRAVRATPRGAVVVTGCYATVSPAAVAGIRGVSWVVENDRKAAIPALLCGESGSPGRFGYRAERFTEHARASVKIQDGCDRGCAYCRVPQGRGGAGSAPMEEILEAVRGLDGYSELVLTGVDIGSYEDRGRGLATLVRALLEETAIGRIRLSSIEPDSIGDDLADAFSDARVCPHLHVPLQSGSDGVLRRMGRTYDTASYRERIARVRRLRPDLFLGTDVMVGFPGETEEDFEKTCVFAREMEFAALHVFRFSPRPGTAAARMGRVPAARAAAQRSEFLRRLSADLGGRYRERFVGRRVTVVVEENVGRGRQRGTSENYLRVEFPGGRRIGSLARVLIVAVPEGRVLGRCAEASAGDDGAAGEAPEGTGSPDAVAAEVLHALAVDQE
jgi:threonylcarbamoyladenosine tRNA methylthiotransferase MtaB